MVIFAMANGALMPKLPYVLPWHIFGSALVVAGTALMCSSPSFVICLHHNAQIE
jgi:hypothetical protein